MPKTFCIAALFAFPFWSVAQKTDTSFRYLNDQLQFTTQKLATYNAKVYHVSEGYALQGLYEQNSPMFLAYYKDSKLTNQDGSYSFFYPDGTRQTEGNYIGNQKTGVWKVYHPNGRLKDSGRMSQDQMIGIWLSWYPDGKLKSKQHYTQGGKTVVAGVNQQQASVINTCLEGPYESWYPNGTRESEGSFAKGKMTGQWKWYHPTGHLSTIEEYDGAGKIAGMTCYDSLGKEQGDFCSIQKPAVLIGHGNFREYLLNNFSWPPEAFKKKVTGTVWVRFTIDKTGNLVNFKVRGNNEVLAYAVHRFIKQLPGWYPAVSHNRIIPYEEAFELPFERAENIKITYEDRLAESWMNNRGWADNFWD